MNKVRPVLFTGPLTLQLLEEAYNSLVYGYTEPDIIKCSKAMEDKLYIRFGLCRDTQPMHYGLKFNNAIVFVDDTVPDDTIIIGFLKEPDHFKSLAAQPFATVEVKES